MYDLARVAMMSMSMSPSRRPSQPLNSGAGSRDPIPTRVTIRNRCSLGFLLGLFPSVWAFLLALLRGLQLVLEHQVSKPWGTRRVHPRQPRYRDRYRPAPKTLLYSPRYWSGTCHVLLPGRASTRSSRYYRWLTGTTAG